MAGATISVTKIAHQCFLCESTFYPKRTDRLKFCSRDCGLQWSGFKHSVVNGAGRVSYTVRKMTCAECGTWFEQNRTSRYCSDDCIKAKERNWHHLNAPQRSKRDHTARQCKECGEAFAPEYGNQRRAFCSQGCLVRNVRRTRRKKERARNRTLQVESVDVLKVFDRDGWRCQFCKVKTPRSLRGTTKSNAPELDHIQPLSKGGSHTYQNVQCLCRKCNGLKGAMPKGQTHLAL